MIKNITIDRYKEMENISYDISEQIIQPTICDICFFMLSLLSGSLSYKECMDKYHIDDSIKASITLDIDGVKEVVYEIELIDYKKRSDVISFVDDVSYKNRNRVYPIMFFIKEGMIETNFLYDNIIKYVTYFLSFSKMECDRNRTVIDHLVNE